MKANRSLRTDDMKCELLAGENLTLMLDLLMMRIRNMMRPC